MGGRLVLVRHGESLATVNQTIGGSRSCKGLSEFGRLQTEALAARWTQRPEFTADVLMASNFRRAIETAEILAPSLGSLPVEQDAGFGELDPGAEVDGMTYAEFNLKFSKGPDDWDRGGPYQRYFPGGETVAEMNLRIGAAAHDLLDRIGDGTAVVVCHGGVIDGLLRQALETSPMGDFQLWTANVSITEVIRQEIGNWRIVRYNDSAHLYDVLKR